MNATSFLLFIIALLGGVFFLIVANQSFKMMKGKNLSRYRSGAEGVCDLLNYGSVIDDGIILLKNGALMASWVYIAEDSDNSTDHEKNYVAVMANNAFTRLGNGYMVHFDSLRIETTKYTDAERCHFPNRITLLLDDERRQFFEKKGTMYEGQHVVTLTYLPPLLAQQKFVEMLFDDEGKKIDSRTSASYILEDFKVATQKFETALSSIFKVFPLRSKEQINSDGTLSIFDEQLSYLQFCLTGIRQPILLPELPVYLDVLLGGQELWGGTVPRIGQKYIRIVAIEGFPPESYPGILRALSDVPIVCRFSNRFIFQDKYQALAAAIKFQKKWQQKVRGLGDVLLNRPITPERLNQDALAMVEDASEAISEIEGDLVAYGFYTGCVVLMDEDRRTLDIAAQDLCKIINTLGFAARVETVNTLDAFLGSLPGHGAQNVRRPAISTLNFAHFISTFSIYTGSEYAPCPFFGNKSPALLHCVTRGNTPYRLNLHVGDVGHTLIVGPTGSGKSTLLGELATSTFVYEDNTVFAFDKGMSLYPFCKAAEGNHYNIASEDEQNLCFNPFQFMQTPSDQAWGLDWIEKLLALTDTPIYANDRNEIANALQHLSNYISDGNTPTITHFLAQVQSNKIRTAMEQYGIGGTMGNLLASPIDGLGMSRFNVFEIEKLMELGDRWALPVLDYLFRRIHVGLKGQPSWIFADEAWLLLQHPVFAAKIREWLKVMRKANCSVVLATQNLNDFANSPIFSDIIDSTASKIYLPNPNAKEAATAEIYKRMGLNAQQIHIIATSQPKREYYHVTPKGKRLFELELGPLARCIIAANDKKTISNVKEFEAIHGDEWLDKWVLEHTQIVLPRVEALKRRSNGSLYL